MQTHTIFLSSLPHRQLDLLENLTHKETPSQREIWKRKILKLREDQQSIHHQGEHYDRMVSAGIRQCRERDELLAKRRRHRGGGDNADEM
jgi:hypothetical protein